MDYIPDMINTHTFESTILREYDIRGIVGKTLHVLDAAALGRAFGSMIIRAGGKKVMVGYDGRTHSPDFEAALVDGLVSTGCDVVRIGLGPTPMLYFAVHHAKASGGIMVTGSHNPSDQNGFKMLMDKALPGGGPVYGQAIRDLAATAAKADYVAGTGSATSIDIREDYIARLLQDYKNQKPLKVVWDCGNGAAGEIVTRLVKKLPGEHTLLFADIDGSFPNHHPDPTEAKNLVDLQRVVAEKKADLGIAFDGDGDRIGAIDGQGRIVAGDQLLALYAAEVLKTHPGAAIIADVKASQVLFDFVASRGGKPIMWKTGHSLIKVKMAETNSPLAGEMSGHIFFADTYYGYDDAVYAAIRLLSVVGAAGKSLAELRDTLPSTVATPELRFPVDESRKFGVIDEVKKRLSVSGAKVNDTDGVRVMTADGWWLLRASNTQAVLVARAESQDEDGLRRLKQQIDNQLKESGLVLPAA
jgi:phosphomannomutase